MALFKSLAIFEETVVMVDGATTDEFSREGLSRWFEFGAKVVSLSIGFTYFIGFLVVAWYLSRYGVSSLSLLHLQYLVAGLWVVLPPSFVALLMLTKELPTIHLDRRVPKIPLLGRFAVNLFTTLPAGIVFTLFVGFLIVHLTTFKALVVLFLLVVIGLSISLFISSVRLPPGTTGRLISRNLSPFYGGIAATAVGFYVWLFAANIYPAIPYEWGGGKPLNVIFLEGDKPLPDGIVNDGNARHSIAYQLLVVTEKSYVVLPQAANQKSLQFDRESIQGIVVLK
jgi:hypothetical protein